VCFSPPQITVDCTSKIIILFFSEKIDAFCIWGNLI